MWDSCGSKAPKALNHLLLTSLLFELLSWWTLQLCLNKVQKWDYVTLTTLLRLSFCNSEEKNTHSVGPHQESHTIALEIRWNPRPVDTYRKFRRQRKCLCQKETIAEDCCSKTVTVLICWDTFNLPSGPESLKSCSSAPCCTSPKCLFLSFKQCWSCLTLRLTYLIRVGT